MLPLKINFLLQNFVQTCPRKVVKTIVLKVLTSPYKKMLSYQHEFLNQKKNKIQFHVLYNLPYTVYDEIFQEL